MKRDLTLILSLYTVCCILYANTSYAEEEPAPPAPVQKKKVESIVKASEELTKEQKIESMESNISIYGDELISRIPAIVKEKDSKGSIIYKYKKESDEVLDFKDLDDETIASLYRRVVNEAVVIRTDRITRQVQQQMELLRATQRPPVMPQPPLQPVTPPPQPPRTYSAPPAPPSLPPSPPSSTRR